MHPGNSALFQYRQPPRFLFCCVYILSLSLLEFLVKLMTNNMPLKIKNGKQEYVHRSLNISHLPEQYNKELHLKQAQGREFLF